MEEKSKKNKLRTRIISASIFLIILFVAFINKYTFLAIFEFIMLQSLYEFLKITRKIDKNPKIPYTLLIAGILFLLTFLVENKTIPLSHKHTFFISLILIFGSFIIEIIKKQNIIDNVSAEITGLIYIAIPFSLTNLIVFHNKTFDYKLLLTVFILIWTYDVSAYFVGSLIGKRKIFPNISPKKTLEGTIGGLILGGLSGIIIHKNFHIFNLHDWIIISFLTVIGAFLGDLVESKIKRSAKVKDSGKIMPGHGGLLDRFDSFIFASLFALFYIIIFA